MLYLQKYTKVPETKKIHMHGQKQDDDWAGTGQSHKWHLDHKMPNQDTQLKQQIQSWEAKEELVSRKMATNEMLSHVGNISNQDGQICRIHTKTRVMMYW